MRVAVLSDIHANLVALDAVLDDAASVDAIWHLGDVVGYGPEPDAVVERLASVGAVGVTGNHDRAAIGGREIDWFNADARAAMEWTRRRISPATTDWLGGLPDRHTVTDADALLVHGSPRDPIWEYVTSAAIAKASLGATTSRLGLHGHTHVPMAWADRSSRVEAISPQPGAPIDLNGADRLLLNPGSVGQPRDGDARSSWLELDFDTATGTWHRVAYDVPAVQAAMRDAGLPARLADRLGYGL